MNIRKYALGVEYNGSPYCGWQQQKHCVSIQQHLQEAISFVADHPVQLTCAGRTDAGVHAVEQIAHFESSAKRDNRAWVLGSNCRLPRDIRIKWVVEVDENFHARFSAIARSYRYIILNSATPSGLFHDRCSWEYRALDERNMHDCAQQLLGEHDFSAFRAVGCQAKSVSRNIHEVSIQRQGTLIYFDIKANAFLYHMVRNIAGSLMTVGKGEQSSDWFAKVLASRDRDQAGITAPAAGLYFVHAYYPEQFKLPTQAQKPVLF